MQQFIEERGEPSDLSRIQSMTYVYGATLKGTAEYVEDYVTHDMGIKFPDDGANSQYQYCLYAGRKLFYGIAATVPAAAAAMHWLKDVARQMPNGKRMEWRTPTGFLVQHDYRDSKIKNVFIRSCGITETMIKEYTDGTKSIEMSNAISPNFVHALDASHLMFTAERMKQAGLSMVSIHDSFGTHMCDVGQMHTSIREAFVALYSNRNVMAEFLWDVGGTGETPLRGNFDLRKVLDSEFFFC